MEVEVGSHLQGCEDDANASVTNDGLNLLRGCCETRERATDGVGHIGVLADHLHKHAHYSTVDLRGGSYSEQSSAPGQTNNTKVNVQREATPTKKDAREGGKEERGREGLRKVMRSVNAPFRPSSQGTKRYGRGSLPPTR